MAKMDEIQKWNAFEFGNKIDPSNRLSSEGLMWTRKSSDTIDGGTMKADLDKVCFTNCSEWYGVPFGSTNLTDTKDIPC
jgi:hypothetical protein